MLCRGRAHHAAGDSTVSEHGLQLCALGTSARPCASSQCKNGEAHSDVLQHPLITVGRCAFELVSARESGCACARCATPRCAQQPWQLRPLCPLLDPLIQSFARSVRAPACCTLSLSRVGRAGGPGLSPWLAAEPSDRHRRGHAGGSIWGRDGNEGRWTSQTSALLTASGCTSYLSRGRNSMDVHTHVRRARLDLHRCLERV